MKLAVAIAVVGFALLVCGVAFGQHHHEHHRDFYQHWKQPGTNVSCCNARVEKDGREVGDCEPTKAEIRAGHWWAWVRQESRWHPIPDDKIIRERSPAGQDAHHCWTPASGTLCFVPPDTGG